MLRLLIAHCRWSLHRLLHRQARPQTISQDISWRLTRCHFCRAPHRCEMLVIIMIGDVSAAKDAQAASAFCCAALDARQALLVLALRPEPSFCLFASLQGK